MLTSSNGYIAYLQFDESLREPVGNKHWKTLLFTVLSSQLIINFKKVRSPKSIMNVDLGADIQISQFSQSKA
jgi:hypothetical protein